MNPAKLTAVIVNWNLKDDTLECIDSLINAGLDPEEIILIDNVLIDRPAPSDRTGWAGAHLDAGRASGLGV